MTTDMKIDQISTQPKADAKPARFSEAELARLKKVCADFESIFTYQLLKTMRQTVPQNKSAMSSFGKDTYTMIFDQKLAESISATDKGLGLKKVLYDQLTNSYNSTIPKEVTNKLK